jgi:hypothetical protein
MGLINNNRIPNNDRRQIKPKTNSVLICFWLYKNIDKRQKDKPQLCKVKEVELFDLFIFV